MPRRRARAGLFAVLLALAAGACSSTVGRGLAMPGRNVQVDAGDKVLPLSRDDEGPAVLVDQSNPSTVYLADTDMTSGACTFHLSLDQGASWKEESAPVLLPFTQNCAEGMATFQGVRTELQQGPDGTLYLVFQANAANRNGTRSVMLARSNDGGSSWTTVPIDAGTPAADAGQGMEVNFEGHIAIDPANPKHIYAMWRRSFSRFTVAMPNAAMMAISKDGGDTWSAPQVMFQRALGSDGPRPIVVGATLYAFWREAAPSVTGSSPLPTPPTTKNWVSISTDGGRTWTDHLISQANDASEPVPLYDKVRKEFYAVWHDNRAGRLDVYFSSSPDGMTWSTAKKLNDDVATTTTGHYYPQISLAPNGRIDVAWYDWRDDPFPPPTVGTGNVLGLFTDRGKVQSVYTTSSRDGGRTWTRNVKVNDVPIDRTIGSWVNNIDLMAPISISSFNAGTIIAWSDTRNGNAISQTQDIYSSTVLFGQSAEHKVTGLEGGIAGLLLGLGIAMCVALLLMRRQSGPTALPRGTVKLPEAVS